PADHCCSHHVCQPVCSEREVVRDDLGPSLVAGGRQAETVEAKKCGGGHFGDGDPARTGTHCAYLPGNVTASRCPFAEVAAAGGGGRHGRERREWPDRGDDHVVGASGEAVDDDGEVITPLIGAAPAHDVVAAGQEHGSVEVLGELGEEPVADPAGGSTELTDL